MKTFLRATSDILSSFDGRVEQRQSKAIRSSSWTNRQVPERSDAVRELVADGLRISRRTAGDLSPIDQSKRFHASDDVHRRLQRRGGGDEEVQQQIRQSRRRAIIRNLYQSLSKGSSQFSWIVDTSEHLKSLFSLKKKKKNFVAEKFTSRIEKRSLQRGWSTVVDRGSEEEDVMFR